MKGIGRAAVLKNLNKEIQGMKTRTMKGLIRAAIIVRRDMEKTSPKIPVHFGHLRDSWFTAPQWTVADPTLVLGFTASYAVYVHENVGANFQRPGAGAKFFQAALHRNEKEILKTIRDDAKVKS